jgi:hypothetical protein
MFDFARWKSFSQKGGAALDRENEGTCAGQRAGKWVGFGHFETLDCPKCLPASRHSQRGIVCWRKAKFRGWPVALPLCFSNSVLTVVNNPETHLRLNGRMIPA